MGTYSALGRQLAKLDKPAEPTKVTGQILYVEVWEGRDGMSHSLEWTARDQAAADREGWNLFDTGRGWEIERDDERGEFTTDESAIAHCEMKAEKGSIRHATALAIHYAFLANEIRNKRRAGKRGG